MYCPTNPFGYEKKLAQGLALSPKLNRLKVLTIKLGKKEVLKERIIDMPIDTWG